MSGCRYCYYSNNDLTDEPCEDCKYDNDTNTFSKFRQIMDINDYQRLALRTANDKCHNLLNGCIGLAGETGEVCDLVKKHIFQGHTLDKLKVAEEISDILWYCSLLSDIIKIDLGTICQMNIDKLAKRYPNGFDPEKSINREEE